MTVRNRACTTGGSQTSARVSHKVMQLAVLALLAGLLAMHGFTFGHTAPLAGGHAEGGTGTPTRVAADASPIVTVPATVPATGTCDGDCDGHGSNHLGAACVAVLGLGLVTLLLARAHRAIRQLSGRWHPPRVEARPQPRRRPVLLRAPSLASLCVLRT